jgi:hypothetical protein
MLVPALMVAAVAVTAAQSVDACRAIKNDQERLACFDARGNVTQPATPDQAKPVPQATPPVPPAGMRDLFAQNTRRVFLAQGRDLSVISYEFQSRKRTELNGIGYPRLTISGAMPIPWLFQIMTKTDLLESARAVGFVAAEFQNTLEGSYYFDLRGGIPNCDYAHNVCR